MHQKGMGPSQPRSRHCHSSMTGPSGGGQRRPLARAGSQRASRSALDRMPRPGSRPKRTARMRRPAMPRARERPRIQRAVGKVGFFEPAQLEDSRASSVEQHLDRPSVWSSRAGCRNARCCVAPRQPARRFPGAPALIVNQIGNTFPRRDQVGRRDLGGTQPAQGLAWRRDVLVPRAEDGTRRREPPQVRPALPVQNHLATLALVAKKELARRNGFLRPPGSGTRSTSAHSRKRSCSRSGSAQGGRTFSRQHRVAGLEVLHQGRSVEATGAHVSGKVGQPRAFQRHPPDASGSPRVLQPA